MTTQLALAPREQSEAVAAAGRPLRVAFVGPEFATSTTSGGGLGAYTQKITSALRELGHLPEVFAIGPWGVVDADGIRVEFVSPRRPLLARGMSRLLRHTPLRCERLLSRILDAWDLADRVRRRHREAPFDAVQCSSYGIAGLFVRRSPEYRKLVRCGSSRALWERARGRPLRLEDYWEDWLERRTMRGADLSYCPSAFLAAYFRRTYGISAAVIRPPMHLGTEMDAAKTPRLPQRFLVHVGRLSRIKGTDLVAQAARSLYQDDPGLRVVFVGSEADGFSLETVSKPNIVAEAANFGAGIRRNWQAGSLPHEVLKFPLKPSTLSDCDSNGEGLGPLIALGELSRPQTLAVMRRAVATIVPSRVDNLPNVAIESLLLGVPVIGTDHSSVEELITEGINGLIVPQENVSALAAAMRQAWDGEAPFDAPIERPRSSLLTLDPEEGLQELLTWCQRPGLRTAEFVTL